MKHGKARSASQKDEQLLHVTVWLAPVIINVYSNGLGKG